MVHILKNIVYGFAIGDALGVPFEFTTEDYCKIHYKNNYVGHLTHDQPKGTWSDDTSILLCVLDSNGDIEKYKANLIDWFNNGDKFNCTYRFDCGNSIKGAIDSSFTNDSSNNKGNGCLCVALGLALLNIHKIEEFVSLTHNNEECLTESKKYYDIIREVITYGNVFHCDLKVDPLNSGRCSDSLSIAMKSLSGNNSYLECINSAILKGGDTDSHAAMVGALASIMYNIPNKFVKGLNGKEKIDKILKNIKL